METENLKIPSHVAIIVDGNGRWAIKRGLSRSMGHKAGFDNLNKLCDYAFKKGVKIMSLFVFSTENFKREKDEVDYLMNLFVTKFKKESEKFNKKNIKVVFSGRKEPLKEEVLEVMKNLTETTKNNTAGTINFCLNYGGQAEIVDAAMKFAIEYKNDPSITLDENKFRSYLYQDLPQIDFMIRTSGECRISNFMLYSLSYAEMYFPETFFPDFDTKQFDEAILKFNKRDRRFGGINYEKKSN
ncbi:MAG: polyprenyl diphosphate synthase [Bacilli bacterium]